MKLLDLLPLLWCPSLQTFIVYIASDYITEFYITVEPKRLSCSFIHMYVHFTVDLTYHFISLTTEIKPIVGLSLLWGEIDLQHYWKYIPDKCRTHPPQILYVVPNSPRDLNYGSPPSSKTVEVRATGGPFVDTPFPTDYSGLEHRSYVGQVPLGCPSSYPVMYVVVGRGRRRVRGRSRVVSGWGPSSVSRFFLGHSVRGIRT